MRYISTAFAILLVVVIASPFSQAADYPDVDVELSMPDITTLQGKMIIPADVSLLIQVLIKLAADSNGDGTVSAQEEQDVWLLLPDEEMANLSLSLKDMEPVIAQGIGMDGAPPASVVASSMDLYGLQGPVNSSTTLSIGVTFSAKFNTAESASHIVGIAINASYTGDIFFSFRAPEDWEITDVQGLSGLNKDGMVVQGEPVGTVNVFLRERTLLLGGVYICGGIGVVALVLILVLVILVLRRKKSTVTAVQGQPVEVIPLSHASQYAHAAPAPQYVQPATPHAQRQYGQYGCPTCGFAMTYIPQYQRYFCYNCQRYN